MPCPYLPKCTIKKRESEERSKRAFHKQKPPAYFQWFLEKANVIRTLAGVPLFPVLFTREILACLRRMNHRETRILEEDLFRAPPIRRGVIAGLSETKELKICPPPSEALAVQGMNRGRLAIDSLFADRRYFEAYLGKRRGFEENGVDAELAYKGA